MKRVVPSRPRHLSARKLVLSYLVIIMTTSIVFSLLFFVTTADSWEDGGQDLGVTLLLINLITLVVGALLSYRLARRTLRPIEKTLDTQDQYIADASHELRTPLASALISNEVALKNHRLTLAQARTIIEGNVKDMQELRLLSDGLLRESEVQSSVLKLAPVDTRGVAQEAIQALTLIATEKSIIIKNDTSAITVTTDADALRKVLTILLENAIKYSPAKSVITLTNQQGYSSVDITVTDQGIGIGSSEISNIFQRFYRTDQSRSQTTGYGLGLSIAKELLEKVGGKITVKSALREGSEFTVKLPVDVKDLGLPQ